MGRFVGWALLVQLVLLATDALWTNLMEQLWCIICGWWQWSVCGWLCARFWTICAKVCSGCCVGRVFGGRGRVLR